jgi:hypothetical protein
VPTKRDSDRPSEKGSCEASTTPSWRRNWEECAGVSKHEQLPGRIVESTSGLIQIFTYQDGLSSGGVVDMLEDHEGNIWIATREGLDRFRRKNVVLGPFPPPTRAGHQVAAS